MRILMVCEGINRSSIIAQPWNHVYELAKRIKNHGHNVEILTGRTSSSSSEIISDVPIYSIKKRYFLFNSNELLKHLNDAKVDVINWHGSDLWAAIHLWRLQKKLTNNVILTLHSGPILFRDLNNLRFLECLQLYKFWNNFFNAFCPSLIIQKFFSTPQLRLIITLSKRTKYQIEKRGISKKIRVIRSGVDVKRFRPIDLSEMNHFKEWIGFKSEDNIVLYFGPLSSFRGVDTAILAISEVQKIIPSTKLLLLGRTPTSNIDAVKVPKPYQRRKNVFIISGLLEKELLIRYLAISDIIILPFKFWPQVECPLTLLEAMAMGKPLVTTNFGAIPEVVINEENGLLVEPGEPKFLSTAVIRLLKDKDLSFKLGKNARLYVQNFHDWNVIAQQTLDVFRTVHNGCDQIEDQQF